MKENERRCGESVKKFPTHKTRLQDSKEKEKTKKKNQETIQRKKNQIL
jgi:hypothetical protein